MYMYMIVVIWLVVLSLYTNIPCLTPATRLIRAHCHQYNTKYIQLHACVHVVKLLTAMSRGDSDVTVWQKECAKRESNPQLFLGREPCYHYTIGASACPSRALRRI